MAPPYAPTIAFSDQYTSELDVTQPAPQRTRSKSSPMKPNPLQSTVATGLQLANMLLFAEKEKHKGAKILHPSAVGNWESTLEKSIKSIVSIKASHTRAFDTDVAGTLFTMALMRYETEKRFHWVFWFLFVYAESLSHAFLDSYTATGFIVDAKRGLILTNRHVVSPGPIVGSAILTNYEEIDLKPIYRDPVHDFGFMQFDPSKVKFMDLQEIPLSPERAKVGLDIRVVG